MNRIHRLFRHGLAIAFLTLAGSPIAASATDIIVTTTDDSVDSNDGLTSLREAITLAANDPGADTITFAAVLSGQTINLASEIGMNMSGTGDLMIDASSLPAGVTLSGGGRTRIFNVTKTSTPFGSATIKGLTLTQGAGSGGAAYNNGATLIFTQCSLVANTVSGYGGAIYNGNGTTILQQCALTENTSSDGGGAVAVFDGLVRLTQCTLTANGEGGEGGTVFQLYGNTALTQCTLVGNLQGYSGDITLTNCIQVGFSGIGGARILHHGANWVSQVDPGLAPLGDYGGPTRTMTLLPGSRAIDAGINANALDANGQPLTTDQRGLPRFVGEKIDLGAVEMQEEPSLVVTTELDVVNPLDAITSLREAIAHAQNNGGGNTITFAQALSGQTINLGSEIEMDMSNRGDVTIDAGSLPDGLTLSGGGTRRILQLTKTGDNFGSVTLKGLSLTGGNGSGASNDGIGGAICNDSASLTLVNCTLSDNSTAEGGAICNRQGGTLTLLQCTVSGNSATNGSGGAISNDGTLVLIQCTLSGNRSSVSGGAVCIRAGTVMLTNSIAAGNTAPVRGADIDRAEGSTIAEGLNLISVAADSGLSAGPNVIVSSVPGLGALADNGGPTQTLALLPGSPAIDAGSNAHVPDGVSVDQRRYGPRITNGRVDIGAFESGAAPPEVPALLVTTISDSSTSIDGVTSLREAIAFANSGEAGVDPVITFAPSLDGQVIKPTQGAFTITASMSIIGNGPANTIIDGGWDGQFPGRYEPSATGTRIFKIDDGTTTQQTVSLTGLTLQNANAFYDAGGSGGAIDNSEDLSLSNAVLHRNLAHRGGGVYNSGTCSSQNDLFTSNLARNRDGGRGGGIFNDGTFSLADATVADNSTDISSPSGGGIYNNGTFHSSRSTFRNNFGREGGAIVNTGTFTSTRDWIVNNLAPSEAGGILNFGNCTSAYTRFTFNHTAIGGAISNDGIYTSTNDVISNNWVDGEGGGIRNRHTFTATNTTFADNSSNLWGGGIVTYAPLTLNNCTVANNSSSRGGGLYNRAYGSHVVVNISNSVLAGNSNGDCSNSLEFGGTVTINAGNTLVGDSSQSGIAGITNVPGGYAAIFGANILADNGGPTRTISLITGSPAINGGSNALVPAGVSTDQRGFGPRINNGTVDVGAYESGAKEVPSLTVTTTSDNSTDTDSLTSLREAVSYAGTLAGPTTPVITFDPTVFATPQTIPLNGTQIDVMTKVTIQGPGPDKLTIDARSLSRIFNAPGELTLSGLKLTGGNAVAPRSGGGAIFGGVSLVLTNCQLVNNSTDTAGGAVSGQQITATDCSFTGNSAGADGGAIFASLPSTLTRCVFNGNAATRNGGAISSFSPFLYLLDSTFTSNDAGGSGGAMWASSTTMLNCTLAGNRSGDQGGAIYQSVPAPSALVHCTVTGNQAANSGGAIAGQGLVKAVNSIFLGNQANGVANHFATSSPPTLTSCLTNADLSDVFTSVGADPFTGIQAGLPAGNGGPTRTIAIRAGGLAVDAGANVTSLGAAVSDATLTILTVADASLLTPGTTVQIGSEQMTVVQVANVPNPTALLVTRGANSTTATTHDAGAPVNLVTDQRGSGFARNQKGLASSPAAKPDIGAYELFAAPALATDALTVITGGGTIDLAALTGATPSGGTFSGTGVTGGIFDPTGLPLGPYTVTYTVSDGFGASNSATFTVNVAEGPSLTVTTVSDTSTNSDGQTSLREAIAYANTGNAGANPVITFDPALKGGLIRLASVLPQITRVVTIDGDIDGDTVPDITITGDVNDDDTPAAGSTTITDIAASKAAGKLGDNVRIFDATVDLTIDGLVLTGGVTTVNGGGILSSGSLTVSHSIISGSAASAGAGVYTGGSVTVSTSTFSDNSAAIAGGGVYTNGSATVSTSTFSDNSAAITGGGIYAGQKATVSNSTFSGNFTNNSGGGVYTSSAVTVSNSTFKGNSASVGVGGGIYSIGSATVSLSIFSGNSAASDGGGIYTNSDATMSNSTFSGNSTGSRGGGVNASTSATVMNSTFSGNSATNDGGGIYAGSTATVTNSIVLGNSAPNSAEIRGTVTARGLNIIGVGSDTDGSDGVINASSLEVVFASVSANPFTNVPSGTLADNGGPTQTIALKAGSLAIDAASDVGALGSAGVDGTATSLSVVEATFFPAGTTIRIGDEQMLVTAVNGTTLTVTRGVNQTTASAHPAGSPVNHAVDQRGQARVRGGAVDIGAFESAPARLYVNQSVVGGDGSGETWPKAMPELRTATAMAQTDPAVTEIWVASGTYKPAAAGGDRAATFRLRSGLAIYGGFTAGQTQVSQRDANPATNATVLSGDLDGNDDGTAPKRVENSHHVVTSSDTESTAILDGFTISGGTGGGAVEPGGGILNLDGSPVLTRLIIKGNVAPDGGGIFSRGGNPLLINVFINENQAATRGGGLANEGGTATLINVSLSGNLATNGAAISNQDNGSISLTGVTVGGNFTVVPGGAIDNRGASLSARNSIIWGNRGGAIFDRDGGTSTVTDSLVEGGFGGGTRILTDDPQFIQPTDTSVFPLSSGNLRLRSTSPAINAGDNSVVTTTTDLDGANRIIGANVDLGAYELIAPPALTNTQLSVVNGGSLTDLAALTGADPAGGVFSGTGVSIDGNGNYVFDSTGLPLGTEVTVTYTVSGPGGTSNETTFTITVLETPSLTVTTTSDASTDIDGLTSLREAIAYANELGGAQTIRFNGDPAALPKATGTGIVDFHDGAVHTLEARSAVVINNQILTITGTSADRLILRNFGSPGFLLSITNGSTVELSGMTVTGAASSGIGSQNSDLTLRACVVSGNATDSDITNGGGIYNFGGDLTLVDSTVSDNAVQGFNRFGGGIYNHLGTATLRNCTVSGNSLNGIANNYGAGIYNEIGSTLILVNSTVSGNSSNNGTNVGAGIYSVGTLELTNCTVTNNSASGGADILSGVANVGTAHVRNSIISGNTASAIQDWSGPIATDLNNLIGEQPDLRLAPLGDYGGPTLTHALLPGSSAIDAGDNDLAVDETSAPLTSDQRGTGFARVVKGSRTSLVATADIGAFELFAAPEFLTDEIEIQIDGQPLDLASATGVSPTGGFFEGPGVSAGFFDPRTQVVGSYEISYTYTGDFGIINTSTFIIDVIADGGSLLLQKAKAFPLTQVGKKSKVQRLSLTNRGDLPVSGIRLVLRGAGRKDFKITQPVLKTLAPLTTTTWRASFHPKKPGSRRATVMVQSNARSAAGILKGKGTKDEFLLRDPDRVFPD